MVLASLTNRIVEINYTPPLFAYCIHTSGKTEYMKFLKYKTNGKKNSFRGTISCYSNQGLEKYFRGQEGSSEPNFFLSVSKGTRYGAGQWLWQLQPASQ